MKNDRKKSSRPHGRPSKTEPPRMPWDELDKLLVHGEKNEDGCIEYPSYRALAKRFDISHSSVSRYARRQNCLTRREQSEKDRHELSDIKLAELRAFEEAVKRDDIVRAVDRFLVKFEQALVEGRVRCDNPTDYNTLVRLRAFVLGDADARNELVGGFTLEDLQAAHAEYREKMLETTPEMRGEVVPIDDDISRGCRELLR